MGRGMLQYWDMLVMLAATSSVKRDPCKMLPQVLWLAPAFQASIASAAADVARWQRSRELLTSCMHFIISGAILLFVFPAWARSLHGPKLRSLMWLFRFSGSEGGCAVPFIFIVRPLSALRNCDMWLR